LNETDRSLVLLLLEGLSYREMAKTLSISEQNVGVKIHRIKLTLAQRGNLGRNLGRNHAGTDDEL